MVRHISALERFNGRFAQHGAYHILLLFVVLTQERIVHSADNLRQRPRKVHQLEDPSRHVWVKFEIFHQMIRSAWVW